MGKREFMEGSNGYFCVSEDGWPLLQGEVEQNRREVWISVDEPLQIEKMFGPLVFMDLRVTAELATCEWVVERRCGLSSEWREVVRIPGQTYEDFPE